MTVETAPAAHGRTLEDEFTSEVHVHEPHKVGLPPLGSYARELWRRREFAVELARSTLRSQHFNTLFGQVWLILNPLLLALIYFILVDILRGGSRPPGFFAHLVAGLFAFYFFQQSLQQGVRSVTSGGRLILNTAFPRVLLPLSSVMTAFMRFLPTILIYIPIHIASDRPVGWTLLWTIPIFLMLFVLTTGMTLIVAAGHVYFRDLKNFLPYVTRIWLYATPILYFASEVPDRYQPLIVANPIGRIIESWGDVINRGIAPSAADLGIGLAWALSIFVVGVLFFLSREREFAVRL